MTQKRFAHHRQRIIVLASLIIFALAAAFVLPRAAPADSAIGAQCGPGDSHRASLTAYHGSRSVNPCISGTTLRLTIKGRWTVQEIRRVGKEEVTIGGKTETLLHFSFKRFQIVRGGDLRTTDAAGKNLTIEPQNFAQIGGENDAGEAMYTDFWITDGKFSLTGLDQIPADSPLLELVQGASLLGTALELDIKYLVTYSAKASSKGNFPVRLPRTDLGLS
ncbi:hypothetical protein [Demetria terragena]|uniref:hypothetical protein n=1 Tax=Demetria terragena TaxID=63959 RepID=UPI0003693E1E|nr:hypothetical protein [Demetria terragena]